MTILIGQYPGSINELAFVNQNPPKGKIGLVLWGDKYQLKSPRNPFLRLGTGSTNPSLVTWPWWFTSTGVQSGNDELGISIHSPSIKKNLSGTGNLGTVVLGANNAPIKSVFKGGKLRYSFDLKVPVARVYGGATAQIVAYFSFTDAKSKLSFWYGMNVFDLRGTNYQDTVSWDEGSSKPIVTAFAGNQSKLIEQVSSSGFYSTPYTDFRHYEFVVGRTQMSAAITALMNKNPNAEFSQDVDDYILGGINMNPEISMPDKFFSYSRISLLVRNWKVELI